MRCPTWQEGQIACGSCQAVSEDDATSQTERAMEQETPVHDAKQVANALERHAWPHSCASHGPVQGNIPGVFELEVKVEMVEAAIRKSSRPPQNGLYQGAASSPSMFQSTTQQWVWSKCDALAEVHGRGWCWATRAHDDLHTVTMETLLAEMWRAEKNLLREAQFGIVEVGTAAARTRLYPCPGPSSAQSQRQDDIRRKDHECLEGIQLDATIVDDYLGMASHGGADVAGPQMHGRGTVFP